MFGLLARGVSAFVASVSGSQKDESEIEGSSNEDSRSVKSSNFSMGRASDSPKNMTANSSNRQHYDVDPAKEAHLDEIVQFLIDNFAQTEAILASLKISDKLCKEELTVMLRDLVADSVQCQSTCVVRNATSRQIDGVALACKTSIFDKQIDRLCAYQFRSQSVNDAVEFLKYVFNKLDVMYYLNEHRVYKPVFVALVCVRKEMWNNGIGTALMNHVKTTAKSDGSDGLISLCSNQRGHQLMSRYCTTDFASVRYDAFRGMHLHPPIQMRPPEKFHSIYAMLARFA